MSRFGPQIGPLLAPKKVDLNTLTLEINRLPVGLNGLKILHLSDIHAGDFIRKDYLKKIVEMSNSLDPDIAVITGDFSETDPHHIDWCAELFSQLTQRYGIYGVLGNHDIWNGDDRITRVLESNNINILRNNNISLSVNNEIIYLSGIDDYKFGHYDLNKAFRDIPDDALHIFLSHHPDVIEQLNRPVDLLLCGHIHGGQWDLPFLGVLYIPSKYGEKHAWGLSKYKETYIYTSRGIGATSIPLRINCPPEITLIILNKKTS